MTMRLFAFALWAVFFISAESLAAEAEDKGSHILLVWPDDDAGPEFSQEEFAGFIRSLKKDDRLAVYLPGRDALVLRFDTVVYGHAEEFATLVFEGIRTLKETQPNRRVVSLGEALVRAATRFKNTKTERVRAIVLLPSTQTIEASGTADTDSSSSTLPANLETNLVVNEILLYPLLPSERDFPEISALAGKVGGRAVYLSAKVRVKDALSTAYEMIQLRNFELGKAEPLYESDLVCPPAASDPLLARETLGRLDRALQLQIAVLVVVGILLILIIVVLVAWKTGRLQFFKKESGAPGGPKKREAPAFSKISIGVSRIRNSFTQAESQLGQLSADIEDFGSENWDTQKNMLSAYSGIADQLFLMLDHVSLKGDAQRGEIDAFLSRRIEQILEDCEIDPIIPETGTRFHSKFHSHGGERESQSESGTILEVVRKGYQRRRGFNGAEPYVIRPAEVIVSIGPQKQGEKK